ncbi:Protein trichome birefringence-like 38 [Linum grandiflorum]
MSMEKFSNLDLMLFILLTVCLLQIICACDVFSGEWVVDDSYSSRNDYSYSCPFLHPAYDCLKYGRTDHQYLKYRWQPSRCNLPRFNGISFLRKMQGKKIMFVGDSVSFNQYNSLICLLHAAVPNSRISATSPWDYVTFTDYGVTVMMHLTHYLVDIQENKFGSRRRVLMLDSISGGDRWKQMDVLIFNTGLWWYIIGDRKGWDHVQYGSTILRDMDRNIALTRAFETWRHWLDSAVDASKTAVFFEGINPVHYRGIEWGRPERKDCSMETRPLTGSRYPWRSSSTVRVIEGALKKVKNRGFHFLNVTTLSELRIDGHPAKYNGVNHSMDCTHWCLAGVPDTWNRLLLHFIL